MHRIYSTTNSASTAAVVFLVLPARLHRRINQDDQWQRCQLSPDFSCGPVGDAETIPQNDLIVRFPLRRSLLGAICTFTQGSSVPKTEVTGGFGEAEAEELRKHGCFVCGSVLLSGDKDSRSQGISTVIDVDGVVCMVLCLYTAALQSAVNESGLPAADEMLLDL